MKAIVVIGAGRTFIAGADIKELEYAAWGQPAKLPALHDLLARIENSAKPVVMALHGTTFGGGLEVAMAGHYRIAARDGVMGQPEVNLGIIPGAEGTQRLPRPFRWRRTRYRDVRNRQTDHCCGRSGRPA